VGERKRKSLVADVTRRTKSCFLFAVFTFKIEILIVLKFEQYQETKQNGLFFELKSAPPFLRFRS